MNKQNILRQLLEDLETYNYNKVEHDRDLAFDHIFDGKKRIKLDFADSQTFTKLKDELKTIKGFHRIDTSRYQKNTGEETKKLICH
jgi:hypothetical protein